MNIAKKVVGLGLFALAFSSCATLFTGTTDKISFNTSPSGAVVYIDGVEQCRTPCKGLRVKRSMNDTEVEFKLDGYQTKIITLDKEFNVITVVNLINVLGWVVDLVTGAMFKYDKKSYDVSFRGKGSSASELHPQKINIDTKNNVVEVFVLETDSALATAPAI